MKWTLVALVCALLATRADARTATGYKNGEKLKIKIVEVGGAEAEVHTAAAFRVMAHAAEKDGIDLKIRSGFRSFAKQKSLYKQYKRGSGNLAAPPGFSNHESGRALDLYITHDKVYDWLRDNAEHYGFYRTVPGEAWHWEYLGGGDLEKSGKDRRVAARSRHRVERRVIVDDAPAVPAANEGEREDAAPCAGDACELPAAEDHRSIGPE